MTRTIRSLLWVCALAALGVAAALFIVQPGRQSAEQPGPADTADAQEANSPQKESAPAPGPEASWQTYHGGPSLMGTAPGPVADGLHILWQFETGAEVHNTPVVCGGRVFIANAKGEVFAVDFEGAQVWSRQLMAKPGADGTPKEARLDAPLACFEGLVYAVGADGAITALDAATGEERWRHDLDSPVLGTPNWSAGVPDKAGAGKGRLYIITQDEGSLHCLDAATGAEQWASEGVERCDGSPGMGDGVAVFGSCASALHVISAATGKLERNIELGADSQVASGVAVDDEAAFSGCRSGELIHANVRTGEILWRTQLTDFEIFTTPAVTPGWVVLGADDGFLYGVNRATGEERWKFDTKGLPLSPIIAGDKVVASADGTLYVLGLEDGQARWSTEISDVITAPAVAGSLVIVGSDEGTVTAFHGG